LIGKGVKFIIGGKSADSLHVNINNDLKNLKNSKETMDQIKTLCEQVDSSLDNSYISKEEKQSIKSALDEVRNLEKSKLQLYAKDLAKKIKEYSDENNK
jgi:hypothetical protein